MAGTHQPSVGPNSLSANETEVGAPIGVWGDVARASRDARRIRSIRVERAGTAFLVLTREEHGEFDTWLETAKEVRDYLSTYTIHWVKPSSNCIAPAPLASSNPPESVECE